jgi:hypothetical protein
MHSAGSRSLAPMAIRSPRRPPHIAHKLYNTVPLGATSGTATVEFNPASGVTNTGTFPFTRFPNIRIRAALKELSSSQSEQFVYRLLGGSSANAINDC